MRQSTRLIVNTAATYLRMLLTVGMGLLIVRILVNRLGEVGYGLLVTLGAAGGLLGVLQAAMSTSVMRHMAAAVGRKDEPGAQKVYTNGTLLFGLIGAVIVGIGLALTPAVLAAVTVPEGREDAARWVWWLNLATIGLTIMTTPALNLLTAKQMLVRTAVLDTIGRALMLGLEFRAVADGPTRGFRHAAAHGGPGWSRPADDNGLAHARERFAARSRAMDYALGAGSILGLVLAWIAESTVADAGVYRVSQRLLRQSFGSGNGCVQPSRELSEAADGSDGTGLTSGHHPPSGCR